MTLPRRRTRGLGAAVAVTALAAAAAPAGAAATGATTIDLRGAAASALTDQGVKLAATKPAKAGAKRIVLPVSGGAVASATRATLKHRGAVAFRVRAAGRTRTAKLTAWETRLAGARSTVTAKLGGKRIAVFTIAAPASRLKLSSSAGTAGLAKSAVRLTPAGAKALRRALRLRRLAAGPLGSAKVSARVDVPGQPRDPTTPGPPTTPGTPNPGTPPAPRQCQGYATGNVPEASAPLDRSAFADAANVADAPMRWYARDSWVRYINGGEGGVVSDGAVLGPVEYYPEPTDTFRDPTRGHRLVYSFTFAFDPSRSWYSPGSEAGVLAYKGAVRFLYGERGIDLTFRDPEIELNGARSRVVFSVAGAACSNLPSKRVEMFTVTVPTRTGAASPYGYASLPAKMTAPGATLFSGQYEVAQDWGSFKQLSITTAP